MTILCQIKKRCLNFLKRDKMNYVKIGNKKYPLVDYLNKENLEEILKKFNSNKMHYEYIPEAIKIKTKYIGNFKADGRTSKTSQVYLCQSKKGYYLSLDHGFPKPGFYGKYDSGKNIFGKKIREEYSEGFKDLPELEYYLTYFLNIDMNVSDENSMIWEVFVKQTSF